MATASHCFPPNSLPQGLVSLAVRALWRAEKPLRGGSFLTDGWRPVLELHAFAKGRRNDIHRRCDPLYRPDITIQHTDECT